MKRFEEVASLLACTVDDLDIKRVTEEQEQKLVAEESDLNLAILVWLHEAVGLLVLAHVLPQSQHTRATARPSTRGGGRYCEFSTGIIPCALPCHWLRTTLIRAPTHANNNLLPSSNTRTRVWLKTQRRTSPKKPSTELTRFDHLWATARVLRARQLGCCGPTSRRQSHI